MKKKELQLDGKSRMVVGYFGADITPLMVLMCQLAIQKVRKLFSWSVNKASFFTQFPSDLQCLVVRFLLHILMNIYYI